VAGLYDLIAPPVNSVFEQNCKLFRFSGLLGQFRCLTVAENLVFTAEFRRINLFFKTSKIIYKFFKKHQLFFVTTILRPYFSSLTGVIGMNEAQQEFRNF
jgi:hypothetical protein